MADIEGAQGAAHAEKPGCAMDPQRGGAPREEAPNALPLTRRPFIPGDEDPRDAALHERVVGGGAVWQGRVVRIEDLEAVVPSGAVEHRDIIRHPGGVAVVAITDDGLVATVRQYRTPFDRVMVEIPAGKLDHGEDPADAVRRELREETGLVAQTWRDLGAIAVSPGCSNEVVHVYVARDLSFVGEDPDDDEFLHVDLVPLEELVRAVRAGKLTDAKTVVGVLAAWLEHLEDAQ